MVLSTEMYEQNVFGIRVHSLMVSGLGAMAVLWLPTLEHCITKVKLTKLSDIIFSNLFGPQRDSYRAQWEPPTWQPHNSI